MWLGGAGVVVLLAAAFALSYDPFTALARSGGITPRLVKGYPVVFDAALVVAFAAVYVLRGARFYIRWLTWLAVVGLLACAGAATAIHAAGIHPPHRPLAAGVAIAPWVMVILGFRLWLTMLRHVRRLARARSAAVAAARVEPVPDAGPPAKPVPAEPVSERPVSERPVSERPGPLDTVTRAFETRPPEPEPAAVGTTGDPVASQEAAATSIGRTGRGRSAGSQRPAPAVRRGPEPAAGIGDEDELLADDGPSSDPVSDEAEPDEAETTGWATAPYEAEPAASVPEPAEPVDVADETTRDDVTDEVEPVDEPDEVELVDEADDAETPADPDAGGGDDDETPNDPPSGRMRSSPLPPMDWGPGLGGLTGRRKRDTST